MRARRGALVGLSYLGLSVLAYIRAWSGGPNHTLQFEGGDLATYLWGLRWAPHAVTHGHNPFFSDWLNHPDGVNLLNNTGPILLGLLVAPVTLAIGEVASYNVLQTLALASSAGAMYVLLRRWTDWWPAAFLGGLLYGFSPYMISSGWSHLPLMFAPVPPLIVLCMDELLVRQRGSARRWGAALGVLVSAQFFLSSEMLADTAEACVLGTLLLTVMYRRQVRSRLRYALTGLATAVSLATVVLAYPIWFALRGPQHAQIEAWATEFSGDLAGPVVPTSNQLLSTSGLRALGDELDGYAIEYMGRTYAMTARGYLGLPLVILLLVIVVRYRRSALIRVFAPMTAVMFVASLGPELRIANRSTGIPLPAAVLTHLPVLEATSPDRYALLVVLGAAVLLAVGLDHLRDDGAPSSRSTRSRSWRVAAVAVACLIPLVPAAPYSMTDVDPPEYFREVVTTAVPAGSVLLTYPFPGPLTAEPMAWQAEAEMHYRMVGGYQFVPDEERGATLQANEGTTQRVLSEMHRGNAVATYTPSLRRAILEELDRWRVATVVVVMTAPRANAAVRLFTQVLGRPPDRGRGVAVWYEVRSDR